MNFNKNKKNHIQTNSNLKWRHKKTNENKKYVYKLQVTNNKVTKKHTEKTPDDVEMFCSH